MKLFYLSNDNLRNAAFVKDLVYNYKGIGKSILLHDHFGGIGDTRFVTKRISALMSEEMIVNNPFSGDQRSIVARSGGELSLRGDFLQAQFATVDLIVLNALGMEGDEVKPMDSRQVLGLLRAHFGVNEVHLFPKNVRSPLVSVRRSLSSADEVEQLRSVYEEEGPVLDSALGLLPVILAAPGNFKLGVS